LPVEFPVVFPGLLSVVPGRNDCCAAQGSRALAAVPAEGIGADTWLLLLCLAALLQTGYEIGRAHV